MAHDSFTPSPDDFPDSEEAELIAFMDGELEPAEMQRVESLLASDPRLRAKAMALKKTFDLLDYLPKPEPSVDFATRTLDKLPTSKASSPSGVVVASSASPSSSAPLALTNSGHAPTPSHPAVWPWVFALVGGVALALGAGYFGTAAAREYLQPRPALPPATAADDDEPPERVVRLLPLYAVADDLEFVEHLADEPALFDEEPTGSFVTITMPWAAHAALLSRNYQALSLERQKQILKLDQQLFALPVKERDRLLASLEAFAVWLDRLPEAERNGVLTAATPGLRLKVVRELREAQAQAALPERIRSEPDAATRTAKMRQWEADEAERRRAWAFARDHWDAIRGTRVPWPFDNDEMKKQVIDYAKTAYRFDEKAARPKLLAQDAARLLEAYREGEEKGVWLWFGWVLYDLAPRYDAREPNTSRYEMFPEPAEGRPITEFSQLPPSVEKHYSSKPQSKVRLERFVGRWPDFALAVHDDITRSKQAAVPPPLGPARLAECAEPLRTFANRELIPELSATERLVLRGLEGRWPEYPRMLIRTARNHDLSLPGVMLPGKPSDWERTYGGIPGRPARARLNLQE